MSTELSVPIPTIAPDGPIPTIAPDGPITARARRAAERAVAKAIREANRDRLELLGYGLMSSAVVSAVSGSLRVGNPDSIVGIAYREALRYAGVDPANVAAETLAKLAVYVGAAVDDPDNDYRRFYLSLRRGDRKLSPCEGLALRMARQHARTTPSGGGSMPRLVLSASEARDQLKRLYRDRGEERSPYGVLSGRGVWLPGVARSPIAWIDSTRHMRGLSDSESELLDHLARWERAERSPSFSPWLNVFGDTLPDANATHPYGAVPLGVPESDAPSLRRGSLVDRLRAIGIDGRTIETIRAYRAAWDLVEGEGGTPNWADVARAVGDRRHPANVARGVRAAVRRLQAAERIADVYIPEDSPRPSAGIVAVPTGRVVRSAIDDPLRGISGTYYPAGVGRSVIWPAGSTTPAPIKQRSHTYDSGYVARWETTPDPEAFQRWSDSVRATRLAIAQSEGDYNTVRADHLRRRLWLARWNRVGPDTPAAVVRAIIERDTYGPRPRLVRPLP